MCTNFFYDLFQLENKPRKKSESYNIIPIYSLEVLEYYYYYFIHSLDALCYENEVNI